MQLRAVLMIAAGVGLVACENVAQGTPTGELEVLAALDQNEAALNRPVEVSPAGNVEEIYAFRTVRDSRTQPPTAFCANVGFTAFAEDAFTAYTYRERFVDGRVVNPLLFPIGNLRGCVGQTSNPDVVNFYMTGSVGDLPETTFRGTCTYVKRNNPEPGVSALPCILDPTAEGYLGGQAVTNTVSATSAAYQTPSFMHLRLWRKATPRELRDQAE